MRRISLTPLCLGLLSTAFVLPACSSDESSGAKNGSDGGADPETGGAGGGGSEGGADGKGGRAGKAGGTSKGGTTQGGLPHVPGEEDTSVETDLPGLPRMQNVKASVVHDSVSISFEPVDGARDYRVYVLPNN